MICRGNDEYIM